MPVHKVLDHTGHSEFAFQKGHKVSESEAAARFNKLVKAGYTPAELHPDGRQVVNRSFTPDADFLFYPRLGGG